MCFLRNGYFLREGECVGGHKHYYPWQSFFVTKAGTYYAAKRLLIPKHFKVFHPTTTLVIYHYVIKICFAAT